MTAKLSTFHSLSPFPLWCNAMREKAAKYSSLFTPHVFYSSLRRNVLVQHLFYRFLPSEELRSEMYVGATGPWMHICNFC